MKTMSVKSMTGFGRGEAENSTRTWNVEVRSVNNRYLDVKIKLPRGYASLEDRVRNAVSEHFQRGRVDLLVNVQGDFSDLVELSVNTSLAQKYQDALGGIAESCGCASELTALQLATFPEVLVREQKSEDLEEVVWPVLSGAIEAALTGCDLMRLQEGEILMEDLLGRLRFFSKTVEEIELHVPALVAQRHQALQERLQKLLDNVQLDPLRLAQEIALLADKTDVTEEIVRLRSHIAQFSRFVEEEGTVGRKLDFLIQEFLREVNTIASKINDADIAHLTVALKSELEKIREQIQNIE
ncbi:conserved hypothetical protein [Desulfotalea psychrophila LSv54]|uniref:YicC family protein n=2 Tax=Desulfotalea psychrophila TaxID=84980 RepID=Q6AJ89_DESPS|nr:conserved hypothetical protein [Desulfotalea psychrophila LSv54]